MSVQIYLSKDILSEYVCIDAFGCAINKLNVVSAGIDEWIFICNTGGFALFVNSPSFDKYMK